MSNQPPRPKRHQSYVEVDFVTDPAELAALDERHRENKKRAMYQIGCWQVVDAPLPLLAQYIAELPAADQQEFIKELIERLPAEAMPTVNEAVQLRLGRGAA